MFPQPSSLLDLSRFLSDLGTQVFACAGKRIEQSPGSFNYMPAKMVHEAWLPAGALVFITVDGAWDVNWVEGPPTAADLTK